MIYPHAVWQPGRNAGYRAGRNRMQLVVCHYTVGRRSDNIGLDGYFHWLVRRDGEIVQFAEADALAWHAGTANQWGPGIEVEYLPGEDDDLWTPAAYTATGRLVEWLIGLGIPDGFYDGDRIDPAGFSGFLTHRSVRQPDAHSDYWPDLPRATHSPTKRRHNAMTVCWINFKGIHAYLVGGDGTIIHQFTGPANQYGIPEDASQYARDTGCGLVQWSGDEWTRSLKKTGLLK